LELWIEIKTLNESHEKSLQAMGAELKRSKATLRCREKRLENLMKTPYGHRSGVRDRKNLSRLTPKMKVILNEMNSLFCDVEQVQRTMVLLNGLTVKYIYLLNSPG